MLSAKNFDGENPVHSAVKTGNIKRLQLLLQLARKKDLPIPMKAILETKTKKGRTPLQVACNKKKYDIVEPFLEVCVEEGFCQDVTGVSAPNLSSRCKSAKMLPEAIAKGSWEVLHIFLRVLRKSNYDTEAIIQILNLPDEKGVSPWFYLMECDTDVLRKVCEILRDYDIALDDLEADKYRSTMLHLAYRANCTERVTILEEFGSDPNHKNTRGYIWLTKELTNSCNLNEEGQPDPFLSASTLQENFLRWYISLVLSFLQ